MFLVRIREEYRYFDQDQPTFFDENTRLSLPALFKLAIRFKFISSFCEWLSSENPIGFKFEPDFEVIEVSEQRVTFLIKRVRSNAPVLES